MGILMCGFLTSYHWMMSIYGTLVYGDKHSCAINMQFPWHYRHFDQLCYQYIFLTFPTEENHLERGQVQLSLSLTREQMEKNKSSEVKGNEQSCYSVQQQNQRCWKVLIHLLHASSCYIIFLNSFLFSRGKCFIQRISVFFFWETLSMDLGVF